MRAFCLSDRKIRVSLNVYSIEAAMARSKQVKVSPSATESLFIEMAAKTWQRSEGDILLDGFRRSLASLIHDYESWVRIDPESEKPDLVLRILLIRMAAGESVTDDEIIEAGYDANIDAATLRKIRDCLSQRKNGDVHISQS